MGFTTGDQDIYTENLILGGTTYFNEDITIRDWLNPNASTDAKIGGVSLKDLTDNVFCGIEKTIEASGILYIEPEEGKDHKIISYFDTYVKNNVKFEVLDSLKDFGSFNSHVVKLNGTNTFIKHITFN